MPVNENSYQNGKVYRIWSLDTEDIYIGSSCDTLSNRFCRHKSHYKKWKEGDKRIYCSSYILFDKVGVENCKIELIKDFPCNSKTELNREEGKVMRENKDIIVNKIQAGRTKKEYDEEHKQEKKEYYQNHKEEKKEYYEHNKKEILEKQKEYREENKEELAEKQKVYREQHKEEIAEKAKDYYQEHKEKAKEYYEEHKEELNEKAKEYNQEHKEQLQKKSNCECGGKYTHINKSIHEKTQRHQEYIKSR